MFLREFDMASSFEPMASSWLYTWSRSSWEARLKSPPQKDPQDLLCLFTFLTLVLTEEMWLLSPELLSVSSPLRYLLLGSALGGDSRFKKTLGTE